MDLATTAHHEAFDRLVAHAPHFRSTSWQQRVEKLDRLHRAIMARQAEIREAIWADFRKPAAEVDFSDIFPVTSAINFTRANLKSWMKPRRVRPTLAMAATRSRIQYEPKGTVLIIAPWNFPFMLAMSPLVSAIAAGNTVMIKPSELTPHVAAVIGAVVSDVFTPDEVCVVEGGPEVSRTLLALPFNHVFFTGSPRVGRLVMEAASKHLADVTLELGGKSPVVILPDADLDDAAEKLVFGKCMNAGQTCVAPDYALVHPNVREALVERIRFHLERRYGNAANRRISPDLARIVNRSHYDRICALIDRSVAEGARIVEGNDRIEPERYLAPTVLEGVTPEMALMQEEIFGPVLPVLDADSVDAALRVIHSQPKPLALYVFGRDKAAIQRILSETSAGGTCVNDVVIHFMHHRLPFGGVNNSGRGNAHGFYGFRAFSHERSVLVNPIGWNPVKWMSPPYTPGVRRLIDLAVRWF